MTDTEASAKSARELLALIGDLERATFGGYELDCAIADAIGHKDGGLTHCVLKLQFQHWRYDTSDPSMWEARRSLPNWSTSLDAALSLVPERDEIGCWWRVILERKPLHSGPAWLAEVRPHAGKGGDAIAHTAALALCIAALRARSAQGTEARRAETAQQAPSRSDDGPVAGGDAPKGTTPGAPLPSGRA